GMRARTRSSRISLVMAGALCTLELTEVVTGFGFTLVAGNGRVAAADEPLRKGLAGGRLLILRAGRPLDSVLLVLRAGANGARRGWRSAALLAMQKIMNDRMHVIQVGTASQIDLRDRAHTHTRSTLWVCARQS